MAGPNSQNLPSGSPQSQRGHRQLSEAQTENAFSPLNGSTILGPEVWIQALDSLGEIIAIVDTQDTIMWVNKAMADRLGVPPGDCIGQRCCAFFHGANEALTCCPHAGRLRDGKHRSLQATEEPPGSGRMTTVSPLRDSEGRLLGSVHVVRDQEGGPGHTSCTVQDTTELTQTEEAPIWSKRQLTLLMEHFPDFVAQFDTQLRHRYVNPSVIRAFGIPLEEIVGKRLDELPEAGPAEQTQALTEGLRRALEEGGPNTVLAVWPTEDGNRTFEVRHVPETDEFGTVVGVLGITRDITIRARTEREREELISRLEAQNAELERFVYTVSHDLKCPLITIKGFAGMLAEELAETASDSVRADLARISSAADKLGELLDDLLELSRIGRLANPPEAVSLAVVAYEAAEILQEQLTAGNVWLDVRPDLPIVFGDRIRLREMLQNLIENAVKYMGDTSEPRVEISSRRDGHETVCCVRDHGIGIAARHHERIFGLFDQLDPRKGGSGVGLTLAKRIVEIHGGRIWVESEGEGRGSTFCFTVPDRASAGGYPPVSPEARPLSTSTERKTGRDSGTLGELHE